MSEQRKPAIFSEVKICGNLYYLSGQIGTDPATGTLAGAGIEEQAAQVAANIGRVLKKHGLGMENIIKANCYLTDMGNYARFNQIYAQYFVSRPARTCVAVRELPFNALCEIEVIASPLPAGSSAPA